MPTDLITGIRQEIKRAIEVLEGYESIGPAGELGAVLIQQTIDVAETAINEMDTVTMITVLHELRGIE